MSKVKELRCFCRGTPLLGTYGVDSKGKLFVHVKIFKQNRIYGEMVMKGGPVEIRCRNCLRWHTIHFGARAAHLVETQAPDIQADVAASPVLDGAANR